MEIVKIIILAVIQGVAEFLPISSSGHLALTGHFLNIDESGMITVSIVLHFGTLFAILLFYCKSLVSIISDRQWTVLRAVVIGSIPVVCTGLIIKATGIADTLFHGLLFPGIGLLITAFLLLIVMGKRAEENSGQIEDLCMKKATLIGCSQAFAIWPGISRSGSTIATAIRLGVKKEDAATFSFLLAIPAIAGAAILELLSLLSSQSTSSVSGSAYLQLAIGFIVSFVVGYCSLSLLLAILKKDRLKLFGYYCLIIGTVSVAFSLS